MSLTRGLSVIALFGSVAWTIAQPGYEPALAIVGSLTALLATFRSSKNPASPLSQIQSVSDGSVGVQAGGNVKINNIKSNKTENHHA